MTTELERLCRKYQITARCVEGAARPWPDEWQETACTPWTVTLSWFGPEGKRHKGQEPITLTVSFFQGPAYEGKPPTAAAVLSSLLVDAAVEDYTSFEDWCDDLGYSSDSRTHHRTWKRCLKLAPQVRAFCGHDDAVLSELRDAEH